MAGNSLGALTVLLGLDASEYTRGLTKAEIDAQRFTRNVRASILEVGQVLGGLKLGELFIENTKAIIGEAAALNDLSDATGSSVESLSRLNNQAKISGTDFATLQTALLKLSAGMSGTDDASTKAKEALALLGVTTKDPVAALQEVAVKLNGYADGVNKVGIAVALFGKNGGEFAATLKNIAELQDVGATVTKKQAEEAEALGKEYRRLGVEATTFANAILNDVVPALRNAIDLLNAGAKAGGGFGEGLNAALSVAARPGAVADQLDQVRESLARLKQEARDGKFELIPGLRDHTVASLAAQEQVILRARQLRAQAQAVFSPDDVNVRDKLLARRPEAPFISGSASKAQKDKISDADRYVQSLESQLQATLDLSVEETALAKIYELRQDALGGLNAKTEQTILDYARQIDQAKEAKKAAEDQKKLDEEAARIRARNSELVTREIEAAQREAQSLRDGNESLQEHLVLLKDGEAGLFAYTQAKLAKAAAEKEDQAAMLENAGASEPLIAAIREQAKALKDRAALLSDTKAAEEFAAQQKKLADDLGRLYDDAASSLTDFVTGTKTAKDAFKDFTKSVERDITQMALNVLKNQLLGNQQPGGGGNGIFDLIGKLFQSAPGGGPSSLPGDGGLAYAAAGTTWSGGGPTVVGENGPELVNLPAGARVLPHGRHAANDAGGGSVTIIQNIERGANTQAHRQAALDAYSIASNASRRR